MNDDFFQALASPYRREIIRLLKWKTLSAGEIADQFDISQPSVSRHLDILKRAGIVTAERRANQIFYSLNLSVLQEFLVEAAALFVVAAVLHVRCGAVLSALWNQERDGDHLTDTAVLSPKRAIDTAVEALRRLIESDRKE